MPKPSSRTEQEQRRKSKSSPDPSVSALDFVWVGLYTALVGACVVVMIASPPLRGFAFVGLILSLGLLPIGLRSVGGRRSDGGRGEFDRLARALEQMTSEAGLSDAAKRVLHRRHERELLRAEIERDIRDQDWDAAMVLVKELAERFGYRADAEEFRVRIERARAATLDQLVSDALQGLERLINEHRWTDAFAEAARIRRLYPDSHRVENLTSHVEQARQRYKADLERRFLLASQRDEIDEAMSLLTELDVYLTEDEAAPLREVARGVIGKARDNLGVRFKLALQDRDFPAALEVGERIVAQFPNTRMAEEVRGLLPMLRSKSREASAESGAARV